MSDRHADFEALSAYVDGEAPEWADHVEACPSCRGTAAQLRAVTVAVAEVVPARPAVDRERAISSALDSALGRPAPDGPDRLAARRRQGNPWALGAVAAVVLTVLGFSGLVLTSYRESDDAATVAGPALQAEADLDARAGPAADSGVASSAAAQPPSDLGDVADAATLRSLAQPGSTPLNQRPGATVVGTRPCEEQARTREPTLGPVVYFATARRGQVAGFVVGFGPAPGSTPSPVILLLLAQDGCAELLRSAGP